MRMIRGLAGVAAVALALNTLAASPAQALPGLSCREVASTGYERADGTIVVIGYCKWWDYTGTSTTGGGNDVPQGGGGRPGGGGGHAGPGRGMDPVPDHEESMPPNRELCEQLTKQWEITEAALQEAHKQALELMDRIEGNPVTEDNALMNNAWFDAWQLSERQVLAMRAEYIRFNGFDPLTRSEDGEKAWAIDPNARYGDALSQTLETARQAEQKFNDWEDDYYSEEKKKAKHELNLLLQQIGRMNYENRVIRDLAAEACQD